MSHRGLIGCLLGGCLLLVGCTSVPTSGPVVSVSAEPGRINPGVEIAPAPRGRTQRLLRWSRGSCTPWRPGSPATRWHVTT